MDAGLLAQYAVIALAVLASVAFVFKRQFPGATRRLRIACALPLLREGRADWLRRLGRRIAPPSLLSGDDGCGGCNSCGPKSR
ncbi:DUF6587 family protein [Montanilutibacter psychrotolerans]|uniref:Uncharacterized protein n=1 Tax=Montanilutibacter psychrotolerans TaxID=1327343 RepID=A0A3M8T0B6_9GAMM|nr:DUF6587 family protein [Lysobacter psychrotolerans]RNF86463.1 hypothetical protein EER27_03360 [Lysobacter psychrotolerans]